MSLETHLKQLIHTTGPLSVASFMHEALSHPQYGYYQQRPPFGAAGDFITAPEISQIFGELLGIWCAYGWQQMGSPSPCMLVEMGPGNGTMMEDILRATRHIKGFHDALEVHCIETSPRLTQIQQKRFRAIKGPRFFWHTHLSLLPEKPMLLVANELFDALPIHQYVHTGKSGWREKLIGLNETGNLTFMLAAGTDLTGVEIATRHPNAPEGAVVEHCPAAEAIMAETASRMRRYPGMALIIDYGYAIPGFMDTLQAVKGHSYHSVLAAPGEADITAHVDFSSLIRAAQQQGAMCYSIMTQADFLRAMGIELRAKALLSHADDTQQQDIVSGVERLMSPTQMGELFKVLAVTSQGIPCPAGY